MGDGLLVGTQPSQNAFHGSGLQDVDEMIRNRFEAASPEDIGTEQDGLWPQEFRLEG